MEVKDFWMIFGFLVFLLVIVDLLAFLRFLLGNIFF